MKVRKQGLWLIAIICGILLFSGCDITTEAIFQIPIEIGGDESSKIEIAKNVIKDIQPGLKQRISSHYPNVSLQQLSTLSLSWGTETTFGLTGSDTMVFVQINLQYTGSFDEAEAILQFCADEASTAIGKRSQSPPIALESSTTMELIESLRHDRIEKLYYEKYPSNVKELMVRQNIVSDLISAYDRGGDDLFQFNIIVILNQRSAQNESDKDEIVRCLGRALKDSSPWTRTEAVWGLGLSGAAQMIPSIIPLLDDPNPKVVNEAILSLAKLTGTRDLPISNPQMSEEKRMEAVFFWKDWWEKVRPKSL